MKNQTIIPHAAMEKIIKEKGAKRVSNNAKEALNKEILSLGKKIASKAIAYAEHAGRDTVQAKDIILALRD